MRLSAVLAFTLFALPAFAADSIADQAQAAYQVFAGGKSQPDFNLSRYGTVILDRIAGRWVSLNGPAPGTGIETYGSDTEKFCKGAGAVTLAERDRLTLELTANPAGKAFSQTYTLIAGSTFSEHTEPEAYFEAIGLGLDKAGPDFDQRRALALSLANGTVQLYRPSEDILVITRDKAYPTVLARCPA